MANIIQGTIYDPVNSPVPNLLVKAFDRDLRTETLLGESKTNDKGQYSIEYQDDYFESAEKRSADVFIKIVIRLNDTAEREIARSPIHFNVPADYTLDFKIPSPGLSEFDFIKGSLTPLLTREQGVEVHELKKDEAFDDFHFLSMETGIDAALIALFSLAHQHSMTAKGNLLPDIFYALFRVQFPTKFEDLLRIQEASIAKGIEAAISKNIISAEWQDKIPGVLAQFNRLSIPFILEDDTPDQVAFRDMLGATIDKKKQRETFIETYLATEAEPEKFWAKLAEQPGFTDGAIIKETQKVLRLNLLTNQPALAARLYKLQQTDPDLQDTRDYAKLSQADFAAHITELVGNGTFGDFPAGIEGDTPAEKTENYAVFLEDLVREQFPSDAFKFKLLADQADPFGPVRPDLITFLAQNPEVDITTTRIDAEIAQANFSGINDRDRLERSLKQVNRVSKLSTRYDFTRPLLSAGLDSATAIAAHSKKEFIEKTQGAIPEAEAEKIYRKSLRIDQQATALAVSYRTANDTAVYALNGGTPANIPSIFGDDNLCDCVHCQSVYSPAAYLVDMLGIMQKREPQAFKELMSRREDLAHILLNCQNTNTLLPYIDLVNEVLENQVGNGGEVLAADIPQTNNTAKELAAFPEHEIPAAYEQLASSFSSPQLPFNLALEKTRVFLNKLKCKRYALMELFFGQPERNKYVDADITAEYLELSIDELDYINGRISLPDGFIEDAKLNEVTYYLKLTGLTVAELLQLKESNFLNPVDDDGNRMFTIQGENGNLTTCDLDLLYLEGLDKDLLTKHLRFIRLWKKLNWSITEKDAFFKTFKKRAVNMPSNPFDVPPNAFNQQVAFPLSHILRLKTRFNLSTLQVLSLWSGQVEDTIAAFKLPQSEFDLFNQPLELEGVPTFDHQGSFYRYTVLADKLQLSIEALSQLIALTGIIPFKDLSRTEETVHFIDTARFLQSSPFSIPEIYALLSPSEAVVPGAVSRAIAEFLTTLRTGLQDIKDQYPAPDQETAEEKAERLAEIRTDQQALVINAVSSAFNVEPAVISLLLNDILLDPVNNDQPAIESFLDPGFIDSTGSIFPEDTNGDSNSAFPNLSLIYHLDRLSQFIQKLSITVEEFTFFQLNETALSLAGLWRLPNDTGTLTAFAAFENLLYLLQFRDGLDQPPADWYTLFNPVIENAADAKGQFVDALVSLTKLEKAAIDFLLKNSANGGLGFTFPDDLLSGKNLLNIVACLEKAAQLGATPEDLSSLTNSKLSHTESGIAEQIWKAKYNENDWLEALQEINNPLREKKRNALLSYLLHAPEQALFRTENQIATTNDMYAHFLMDVEMSSCMLTSRIKQAISSVQLFIDRCLMGLETTKVIATGTATESDVVIEIAEEFATQWNEWRKVYRIWEANRKIFLYPENWIEPELRGDKSPFFKELESKLTQNEVTDEVAKEALLEYLEKLDTVAKLEIIAFFPDESAKITHVLGRTKNIPHQYFYRKQENSIWSAWESVELDIQGDHVLLVVWNTRLMVFWGEFEEKQEPSNGISLTLSKGAVENGGEIKSTSSPQKFLEMKLNWSEYKHGKWGAKRVSEEPLAIDNAVWNAFFNKTDISLSSSFVDKKLFIRLITSLTPSTLNPSTLVTDDLLAAFCFDNCTSAPFVLSPLKGLRNFDLEVIKRTKRQNMFLKEGTQEYEFSLYKSGLFEHSESNSGQFILFRSTPGKYSLLPNNHEVEKSKAVKFFYQNEQNTFFVKSHQIFIKPEEEPGDLLDRALLKRNRIDAVDLIPFDNSSNLAFTKIGENIPFTKPSLDPTTELALPPQPDVFAGLNEKTYEFQIFYHPYVCKYIEILNMEGIDVLYKDHIKDSLTKELFTDTQYHPNPAYVRKPYPVEDLDFSLSGSYSLYNWELFFHIPFLIATKLNQNQKFDEARKWFHYIFDPTRSATDGDTTAKRFWITKPFRAEIENTVLSVEELINQDNNPAELKLQLRHWENNPFQPHVVANFRPSAYMRSTVMKYIDNLIDWGDQLFRRDSIESINEATLLYVLAANMLGEKQESIPPQEQPEATTFNTIKEDLNPLNLAKAAIESVLPPIELEDNTSPEDIIPMPLFCLPKNDQLLKYWDTVADRLFKIRHCQNIDGVVRQLPLFEPEIAPGLLVRAANAGLDLNDILNDIQIATPHYRFQVMLQKANEFCNDVKSLGSQFLSTYEKRDAEALALLRSGQEVRLLELVKDIKKRQVDEAKENIKSLEASRKVIEERMNYYGSREFMNVAELRHFATTNRAIGIQKILETRNYLASILALTPEFKFGSGFTIGSTFGGTNLAKAEAFGMNALQSIAALNRLEGESANIKGGYDRRMDDWKFQSKTAELELQQLDKQLIAAEIRLAIAEKDLSNHEIQIEQSREVEDHLRSKFTNTELYNYMVNQLSSLFFQSYQLAYDLAKKAEKCFQLELGLSGSNYIKFGHWDSLKKGLLSGEHLQLDLRRLELAYLEQNKRAYELTKHISIRQFHPMALLELKTTGSCEISIPEWLLDMDCPGHYMRRIKAVSLSIPAIAGPYTSVNCKLSLQKSSIRKSREVTGSYAREEGNEDPRFIDYLAATSSIVTSNAQNDSGLFEVNFRDERFLPFENAGAISSWKLELSHTHRQFDYNTITDVILHLRYMAKDGGTELKNKAVSHVSDRLASVQKKKLHRLFSLRHDFPVEWHQFVTDEAGGNFKAIIKKEHFNYLTQGKEIGNLSASLHHIDSTSSLDEIPDPGTITTSFTDLTNGLNDGNYQSEIEIELNRAQVNKNSFVFLLIDYIIHQ